MYFLDIFSTIRAGISQSHLDSPENDQTMNSSAPSSPVHHPVRVAVPPSEPRSTFVNFSLTSPIKGRSLSLGESPARTIRRGVNTISMLQQSSFVSSPIVHGFGGPSISKVSLVDSSPSPMRARPQPDFSGFDNRNAPKSNRSIPLTPQRTPPVFDLLIFVNNTIREVRYLLHLRQYLNLILYRRDRVVFLL